MSASYKHIQFRRATQNELDKANPILKEGESAFATDTNVLKIGDGQTAWRNLSEFISTRVLKTIAANTAKSSTPGAAGELPVPEVEQSRKLNKKTLKCNKPRRTPGHKTKSHIVKACSGGKEKIIRFGQQGKKVGSVSGTAGKPKAGESAKMKAKRKSFKARHAKNIAKGKMSAAYWADKVKW